MRSGVLCCCLLAFSLMGCGPDEKDGGAPPARGMHTRPEMVAANYPLAYFAERICGEYLDIRFPVPPGVDPAYWMPDAEVIGVMQNADRILLNGAGYEGWISSVSLPEDRLVDTGAAFIEKLIPVEDALTHSHGLEGNHSHRGYATDTWMDFAQAAQQAQMIAQSCEELLPAENAAIAANLEKLSQDLHELGLLAAEFSRRLDGQAVIFSHPVYQYFQRAYGINGRSLHWEPDERPAETAWQALDALLLEHPATLMIWEAEPLAETRLQLEQRGLRLVVIAPLANRPLSGDWLSIMRASLQAATAST